MKLRSLRIKNYRNFEDSSLIPYHTLTIFVGENGSGKTSTIDALALLIDYRAERPISEDVIDSEQPVQVEGSFIIPVDYEDAVSRYCVDGELKLRYSYDLTSGVATYSVGVMKYVHDGFNTYKNLNANDLKSFVTDLGQTPGRTKEANYAIVQEYLDSTTLDKEFGYVDILWSEISPFMPLLQRYSSTDYSRPENIVSKTLATLYRTHFYETEDETGEEKLKQSFIELKNDITNSLNSTINNQLKDRLSRQLDNVVAVGGDFDIDFARGFSLKGISVKFSNDQTKTIDQMSEGHRKKSTLAILEWDAEVSSAIEGRVIIKAYDEPDANLDFPAQRKIFKIINQDVKDNNHISAVICTHSLALIDRAPAGSINRVALDDHRKAKIEYLNTGEDEDIRKFLSEVAEVSGLRNSNIFYEKAFLVVEGESEEACIGLLYKTYTGTTLPEDGIILINIKTNGQWNNVLKFLSANKSSCTVLLLDSDTQASDSTRQVTKQKLESSGFNENFLTEQCFFIGAREFEDTYMDEDIASMANEVFPKADGTEWSAYEFTSLRNTDKFSSEISSLISREHRAQATKPMIAYEMACIHDRSKIEQNSVLKALFDKLQEITRT